jgi:hypothetical protein
MRTWIILKRVLAAVAVCLLALSVAGRFTTSGDYSRIPHGVTARAGLVEAVAAFIYWRRRGRGGGVWRAFRGMFSTALVASLLTTFALILMGYGRDVFVYAGEVNWNLFAYIAGWSCASALWAGMLLAFGLETLWGKYAHELSEKVDGRNSP